MGLAPQAARCQKADTICNTSLLQVLWKKYDIIGKCQIIEIRREKAGFLLEGVKMFDNLEYCALLRLIEESEI